MAKMVVDGISEDVVVLPGVLMIHKEPPALIVIVDDLLDDGDFMGTSIESGHRMQWIGHEFSIFRGKLTLEQ
jgi:hypothetical protein